MIATDTEALNDQAMCRLLTAKILGEIVTEGQQSFKHQAGNKPCLHVASLNDLTSLTKRLSRGQTSSEALLFSAIQDTASR